MPPSALQRIAVLGNYPPRRCGIATFTSDLAQALVDHASGVDIDVIAMSDRQDYEYPARVRHEIRTDDKNAYRSAAAFLNRTSYDVLSVQHEYGIFGGQDGDYLLTLLRKAKMPIVTTFHTVLQEPSPTQRTVTRELLRLSERVVVMSHLATTILGDEYGCSPEIVDHIPHGIPDFRMAGLKDVKAMHGIKGSMILTFGLLSPDKGIQYMIKAMPQILLRDPSAVYVVLGATHPNVRAESGEQYRESLVRLAHELGVAENVQFIDSFVNQSDLVEYLHAADVYVTPYLNPRQITSGTLAYALGAGKLIISTPYPYARELLAEGRGILVDYRNEHEIGRAFARLHSSDSGANDMRASSIECCHSMRWPAVGRRYHQSLGKARNDHAARIGTLSPGQIEPFRCLTQGDRLGRGRGAEVL